MQNVNAMRRVLLKVYVTAKLVHVHANLESMATNAKVSYIEPTILSQLSEHKEFVNSMSG